MTFACSTTDKTILLIEDWIGHARLIRMALAEAGVDLPVIHVIDGKQAASLLFTRNGQALPSVIMLDLSLPDMPGGDLLARIRHDPDTRGLPVIALSAADIPEDRQCCLRLGCEGFLVKPPDPPEIRVVFGQLGLLARAAAE
ncbi:MAG: response regulator [Magnetospirillum sp. WYHS-4]